MECSVGGLADFQQHTMDDVRTLVSGYSVLLSLKPSCVFLLPLAVAVPGRCTVEDSH